jgi:hypothetical protein
VIGLSKRLVLVSGALACAMFVAYHAYVGNLVVGRTLYLAFESEKTADLSKYLPLNSSTEVHRALSTTNFTGMQLTGLNRLWILLPGQYFVNTKKMMIATMKY